MGWMVSATLNLVKHRAVFNIFARCFQMKFHDKFFVFFSTQRSLKPFVQWILECVRYTANDDVRIELNLTVLGHVTQLQGIELSKLGPGFAK